MLGARTTFFGWLVLLIVGEAKALKRLSGDDCGDSFQFIFVGLDFASDLAIFAVVGVGENTEVDGVASAPDTLLVDDCGELTET